MPLKLHPPREGKTPNYQIRGTYRGIRIDLTSGSSNEKIAKQRLKEIERDIDDRIKCGRIAKANGPTFVNAVNRYLNTGGEDRFLKQLVGYFGSTLITEITQEMVDDAAITLLPKATPATRNRQVYTPISAILKASRVKTQFDRPKGSKGTPRTFFFEPAEAERLITAATKNNPEFGIFLQLLLYTGLRLSEGLDLQVRHLSLSEGRAYVETTKNGLPRTVHLPAPLIAALSAHPRGLDRIGKVFRFCKGGRIYRWLDEAAREAKVFIPDGVSFHAFRHTYGAYMRRYGNLDTSGLVASGAWLSHDAARRYEHVDVSAAARASDMFPIISVGGNIVK